MGIRHTERGLELFVKTSEVSKTVIILVDEDGTQEEFSLNELLNVFAFGEK